MVIRAVNTVGNECPGKGVPGARCRSKKADNGLRF